MSNGTGMIDALGVGSPVVDLLAEVPEETLRALVDSKGGMELIDAQQMQALIDRLDVSPSRAAGGSAANTVFTLAQAGRKTSVLGKLGDDSNGDFYRDEFARLGGDTSRFKIAQGVPTARCLCLITPDSERTMRTDLGAAAEMRPDDVSIDDFRGCRHVHLEGYLLFNQELLNSVLKTAKEAGCLVSMDLGSYEVVQFASDILPHLLHESVDMVFANSDEAVAYSGSEVPQDGLNALGEACDTAAVKQGAEGALLKHKGEECKIRAVSITDAVDSTGAGDTWAAGFLYGYIHGHSLQTCGDIAAVFGGEAVRQVGAHISPQGWGNIKRQLPDVF